MRSAVSGVQLSCWRKRSNHSFWLFRRLSPRILKLGKELKSSLNRGQTMKEMKLNCVWGIIVVSRSKNGETGRPETICRQFGAV